MSHTTVRHNSDGISLRSGDTVAVYLIQPGSFCYPVAVRDVEVNATIISPVETIIVRAKRVPIRGIDCQLQRVGRVSPVKVHIE